MDRGSVGGAELMRVYGCAIPTDAAPATVAAWLTRAMPLIPQHVLRGAFEKRDVKMNGVRVRRDEPVIPGAVIEVYTAFEGGVPVVYEDERILLIDKPAGSSAQDDGRGGMTAVGVLTDRAAGAYQPRLCHRLDNQTSGLMLLAKDDEAEGLLLTAFRERTLDKRYIALVRGEMRPPSDLREAYLVKDAENARVRVVSHPTPDARPIATRYETLSFADGVSRVEVTLLTGRTHQIRAHMAYLSHPVLGDDVYGDRAFNRRLKAPRLMLCAVRLTLYVGGSLRYLDGRTFEIAAPF